MSAPVAQRTNRPNPTGRGRWSPLRMLSTHDLLGRLHEVRERLKDRVHLGAGDLREIDLIDGELDRRQVPIDPGPEATG